LGCGARKSLQTDRVILVPGPDQEIAVVREIYDFFTKERQTEQQIADLLNERGIRTDLDRWAPPQCFPERERRHQNKRNLRNQTAVADGAGRN